MDTTRLEAFSDGVFVIAITLLVLEIKVPPPGTAIGRNSPSVAVLSCLRRELPGNRCNLDHHHAMFKHIVRVDGMLCCLTSSKGNQISAI
jgi:uncharacterized membrane protein